MPSLPPTPDVEFPQGIGSLHFGGTHLAMARGIGDREFASRMPAPWAQSDAADSLYKNARELLNRGDWRRAALALKDIPQKYPNSAYAGEALYWQAWALYRIGGQADLTEALNALDALSSKYANRRSQPDVQALTTRILGTLAARGDAKAAAQLKNRADDKSQSCDREEQAVRAEALNALSRTDPDNMSQLMRSVLARKDECSVQLRKSAVFLVGNKRDSDAGTVLINVAKNDPNMEVRMTAIDWLSRIPGDESLNALAELARGTSEDDAIQRAAVRSLVNHPSDKARQIVRSIVERNDMSERLRSEALSAFSSDRTSVEDVAWLRSVYSKLDNQRLKQRALATIVRVGGPDNDQWLMNIVKDDNEPSDFRATALRRIGQSMSVADLGRMYDGASAQSVRSSLINILGNRKEPEATDKLIDIVKTGTDPSLRTQAIGALANKNDARTRALLLEIINK
jgi:HEAT repeat protein